MMTLILGGASSGKSALALEMFESCRKPRLFMATGKALDQDFRQRILDHRRSRNPEISVQEIILDLPQALNKAKARNCSVLVDSLDFWFFSCLEAGRSSELSGLLLEEAGSWTGADLIVVSTETGLGPLPACRQTREFVSGLGRLNQELAKAADEAYFVAAGLALPLKRKA